MAEALHVGGRWWPRALMIGALCLGAACATSKQAAPPPPMEASPAGAAPSAGDTSPVPPFTAAVSARLEADVKAVISQHSFEVPIAARRPVLKMIHHLQHHPDAHLLMEAALSQAPVYRAKIGAYLERDGLPKELFYVAEAESAFLGADLKGKGLAVGLWQMIPSTARHYGLHVDDTRDERADAFKSTDASLRHLVDLYATFHDWELVITGFYAGAGIVERGLELSGATDAWTLIEKPGALPEETRGYLPLVYAHVLISQDPSRFGFSSTVSDAQLSRLRADYAHYYTNRYPSDLYSP